MILRVIPRARQLTKGQLLGPRPAPPRGPSAPTPRQRATPDFVTGAATDRLRISNPAALPSLCRPDPACLTRPDYGGGRP